MTFLRSVLTSKVDAHQFDKSSLARRSWYQCSYYCCGREVEGNWSSSTDVRPLFLDPLRSHLTVNRSGPDGKDIPVVKSLADRLRALQNNGLSVGQTKLREATKLPTPPVSPGRFSTTGTQYNNYLPPPSAITPSNSTHTFVSPSTLGPPSPSSTASSSPPGASHFNDVDFTGFAQAFPTIDELDEHPSFSLPSVPTGIGASLNKSYAKDLRNGDAAAATQFPFRNFTIPIERPSSTPITPTNNNFNSRPSSPNKSTVPLKPSGLSSGVTANPSTPKVPIPVKNIAFPNDLLSYIRDHNVLLIDVRNRVDFEREHIKANAVICIEPSILMREG